MEGKGRGGAVAVCMLIMLLSGHELQQVSAMSEFCRCYKECYPGCRKNLPRFVCELKCMDDCSPNPKINTEEVAATSSAPAAGDCRGFCHGFCLLSICGEAVPDDVATCVDDCTKNWSLIDCKHLEHHGIN